MERAARWSDKGADCGAGWPPWLALEGCQSRPCDELQPAAANGAAAATNQPPGRVAGRGEQQL
jgi:hypothetical protein